MYAESLSGEADVMDGHFVPAITFGAQLIDAVHKVVPNVYLDCHMMVSNPMQWIPEIAKAGGSGYTFHLETCSSAFIYLSSKCFNA